MESNNVNYDSLKTIQGIKFTSREIDVMVCILNGRTSEKSIASFLSISSRTVGTHKRNITQKLGTSSWESIRDFLERSEKADLIKQYYKYLTLKKGEKNSSSSLSDNKNEEFSSPSEQFFKNVFKKRKMRFITGTLVVFSILWGVFFILFSKNDQAQEKDSVPNSIKTIAFIRSDLIIPTENVFLKRSDLINQIDEKLKGDKGIQTVALMGLVGMGGVGKTTLARAYGKAYQASLVWEMNAETQESLMTSFKDLAYAFAKTKEQKEEMDFLQKIENQEEKEKQILSFVKENLREHPHWLLIYDNVENLSEIKKYFPQDPQVWGAGRVIITTRDRNIKNTSYIKQDNIIEVTQLTEGEVFILLSKILYNREPDQLSNDQREKAIKFLKNIPPFPLDISVAAYYIKDTHSTYDQYLERISQYSKDFEKTQEHLLKEVSDYTKTRYGIITSSLEKLIQINPEFKELLFFISLLDSQHIPKGLLEAYTDTSTVNSFIHHLKKNALITSELSIKPDEEGELFFLHRSTQAISLTFLKNLLSQDEKNLFMDKIVSKIKSFYEQYAEKNYTNIILLIPHLNTLIKNLKGLIQQKELQTHYESTLVLMLGNAHYKGTRNLIMAKNYLSQFYMENKENPKFSNIIFANLLNSLGDICAELGHFDEAISFCKESIKLCNRSQESEILIASNTEIMGFSYSEKNDFKNSKYYLETALNKISKMNDESKKEMKAELYLNLGWLYNLTYLNKDKTNAAEEYAYKGLKTLNADALFYKQPKTQLKEISCMVATLKTTLGHIYNRQGKYEKAIEQGFKDAQYIIDHSSNTCSYNLLKAYISSGMGEVLLREGNFESAEKKLTESINIFERLAGESRTFISKVFRIEARIRLRKYIDSYDDFLSIMKMDLKEKNNYTNLLYCTCFYHAAIIKHMQGNFKSSIDYFSEFFKEIKPFCKSFLDKNSYNNLEAKGVFNGVTDNKAPAAQDIQQYLDRSSEIFSVIYGAEHPFVRDYVLKN